MDYTHSNTGQESQARTLPSATAEEIQGLTSNPENFLFRGHIKCVNSTILIAAMYIHCTTCLHIPAYIIIYQGYSILFCTFNCIAHFILVYFILIFFGYFFFLYLYLCIFSCVCVTYNCTVHGADLDLHFTAGYIMYSCACDEYKS